MSNVAILGKVTNLLFLSAYYNPKDTFIAIDWYDNKVTSYITNSEHYCIDNIKFDCNSDKLYDSILWDGEVLNFKDVEKLNLYLEKDYPAYVSNLYCDELEQLLEYEPFLGNKSCTVTSNPPVEDNTVYSFHINTYWYADAFIELLNSKKLDYIVTIGDYQKLLPEDKFKVYNLTKDKETDINNIKALLSSGKNVGYIDSMVYYRDIDDYTRDIFTEVHKLISHNILIVGTVDNCYINNKSNKDFYNIKEAINKVFDYVLISDKTIGDNTKSQIEVYSYGHLKWIYQCICGICNDKSKIIKVPYIGDEFISVDSSCIKLSRHYRLNDNRIYPDPDNGTPFPL